jgi:EAL domain-containing protein (putative c-di-GMP-specific phosphodiesterase class I)/CheY-like chemotaxis protein
MATQFEQWGGPCGVPKKDSTQERQSPDERRVLLVEDVASDAELTVRELHKGGLQFIWRRVQTEVGLRRAIREFRPTLILSDFTLPQFDGMKALQVSRDIAPQTPFIFVSGSIGEERAVDALQQGATNYVLKSNLSRLVPAVTRALNTVSGTVVNAGSTLPKATLLDFKHAQQCAETIAETLQRRAFEHKLRKAVALQQFELHYQPKVCVRTRRIEGVEALLRWREPQLGLLPAAEFLPSLEASGLMFEVSEWILERAARDCRHWRRLGLPPMRTAVNISMPQLQRADFAHRFLQLTRPWASGIFSLDIEITEAALLGDTAADMKKLKLLRSAGIRIAIDDFGSGASSLGKLSDLPIDSLKIDRTFVKGLPEDRTSVAVVSTIISLARGLKLAVVAEGVETREQLETLRQLGCDQSQGYLHSEAVTRDEFSELLAHGKGWLMLPAGSADSTPPWREAGSLRVNAI